MLRDPAEHMDFFLKGVAKGPMVLNAAFGGDMEALLLQVVFSVGRIELTLDEGADGKQIGQPGKILMLIVFV